MRNSEVTSMLIVLMFLLVTEIQAQTVTPSKKYTTEKLNNTSNFSSVRVLGSPDVECRQSNGSKTTVSIYGSDDSVDLLEVSTVNGVLQMNIKKDIKVLSGERRSKVIVSPPSSNQIDIKGSASVYLRGVIKGNDSNLNIAGSGNIEAENLRYADIFALVKGSGDTDSKNVKTTTMISEVDSFDGINTKDSAQKAILTVNGSGDISVEKLAATNVVATVAGLGDIVCYTSRQLDAGVSGSDDIEYKGSSSVVSKQGKKSSTIGK